jgi:hypothetical protein
MQIISVQGSLWVFILSGKCHPRLPHWKSTAVAEGYIEDSLKAKIALANQLVGRNTSSFPAAVASTSSSSFQNIVNEHQENTQAVISEGLTTNRSVVHTRFYFSLYVFFKKKIGIFAIMN